MARTVRKHLGRLAAHGLVLPTYDEAGGATVWQANPDRLQAAARTLAVAGTVARRKHRATQERNAWGWWLADFRAERGWATRRGLRTPGYRTTKTDAPCPAMPFPLTPDGRRDWSAALSLVDAGHGPTTQEPLAQQPAIPHRNEPVAPDRTDQQAVRAKGQHHAHDRAPASRP